MPRRIRNYLKPQSKDPRFQDIRVGALINKVMKDGKKYLAINIVYSALAEAASKLKKDPLEVLEQVLENITPIVEVRSKRIGGGNYQIPTEIKPRRRLSLALRWLVVATRDKSGKPVADRLLRELLDAYDNTGTVVKKREEVHRMAEANKALAHFGKY